jgi:hypothetical protein
MHLPHYSALIIIANICAIIPIIILAYILIYRRPHNVIKALIFTLVLLCGPASAFKVWATSHNALNITPWLELAIPVGLIVVWSFVIASMGKPIIIDDKLSREWSDFFTTKK